MAHKSFSSLNAKRARAEAALLTKANKQTKNPRITRRREDPFMRVYKKRLRDGRYEVKGTYYDQWGYYQAHLSPSREFETEMAADRFIASLEKQVKVIRNPHSSFSSLNAKRARAEAALLSKANKHYARAAQLEKQGKPLQARTEATKGRQLAQRAHRAGQYTDGPVGRLPNPERYQIVTHNPILGTWQWGKKYEDLEQAKESALYQIQNKRKGFKVQIREIHSNKVVFELVANPKRSDLSWEEAERLGILKRAGVKKPETQTQPRMFQVTWHSSLKNKRVGFIRPIAADTKSEAITIAKSMISNDPKAKAFVAREIKRNGIVDIAAGMQALDYLGRTVKGKRNPGDVHIDAGHVTIVGKTKRIRTQNPKSRPTHKIIQHRGFTIERKGREFSVLLDGVLWNTFDSFKKAKQAIALYRLPPRTGDSGYLYQRITRKQKNPKSHLRLLTLEEIRDAAQREANRSGKDQLIIKAQGQYAIVPRFTPKARGVKFTPIESVRPKKKNPSVTTLSKTFQGEANGAIDEYYASDAAPKNLARAGKLVFLKVAGRSLRLPGAMVAIAPNNKLWITGRQALFATKAKSGEGLDMGEVSHICYETAKAHIEDGKTVEYVHEFGEDGGRRPHLIIDHEGMPILRGGDYTIKAEGIVN